MKNLQNHIFSTTTCISKETMLKFINKQLSQKELHEVQTHLLDCEFCTEALEGLAYAKNPSVLFTIDHQINQRTIQKSPSITRILMIAASVLLFVFGGYYTINNFNEAAKINDNEISFQEPVINTIENLVPAQEEIEANQNEELSNRITVVESDKSDADNRFTGKSAIESAEGGSAENQQQLNQQADQKVATTTTNSGYVYNYELRGDNTTIQDSENDGLFSTTVVTEKESGKADRNFEQAVTKQEASKANADDLEKSVSNNSRAKKSAEAPTPNSVSLADEFKSKDVTGDLKKTEEVNYTNNEVYLESKLSGGVSTGSTMTASSNLTNGIDAYNSKKYTNAITYFDLVVSNNESIKNRTEATWYKALCLIELNDKTAALKLLEDLTHYNNEFSLKAENKLKELE